MYREHPQSAPSKLSIPRLMPFVSCLLVVQTKISTSVLHTQELIPTNKVRRRNTQPECFLATICKDLSIRVRMYSPFLTTLKRRSL